MDLWGYVVLRVFSRAVFMEEIKPGTRVLAESADGRKLPRRALSRVVHGQDFLVVWVCREEEWKANGEQAEGVPWPADAVQITDREPKRRA